MGILDRFSKKKYVLRAKCEGETEDIAEFDRKISSVEGLNYIEGMEEKCTSISLDEYRGGKFVGRVWYRRIKKGHPTDLTSELDKLKKLKEIIDSFSSDKDVSEYFASAVMLIKSLKELQRELGMEQKTSELTEIINLIRTLAESGMLSNLTKQAQLSRQKLPQLAPPPPEIKEESIKKVEEIMSKAYLDTTKSITPCVEGGECAGSEKPATNNNK